jgi:hypothetical protein
MPVEMDDRGSLQAFHLVEMAGIEPASREFDPGYTTSLVGLLFFTQASPNRQGLLELADPRFDTLALMPSIGVQDTASRFLWHLIQAYQEETRSDVAALGSHGELRFACYL